jgi:hypothetical protein
MIPFDVLDLKHTTPATDEMAVHGPDNSKSTGVVMATADGEGTPCITRTQRASETRADGSRKGTEAELRAFATVH